MPRPEPEIGDWFRTMKNNQGRCWLLPPSDSGGSSEDLPHQGPDLGVEGTFIGPVHDVEHTR